jgi:hypothetical protein
MPDESIDAGLWNPFLCCRSVLPSSTPNRDLDRGRDRSRAWTCRASGRRTSPAILRLSLSLNDLDRRALEPQRPVRLGGYRCQLPSLDQSMGRGQAGRSDPSTRVQIHPADRADLGCRRPLEPCDGISQGMEGNLQWRNVPNGVWFPGAPDSVEQCANQTNLGTEPLPISAAEERLVRATDQRSRRALAAQATVKRAVASVG